MTVARALELAGLEVVDGLAEVTDGLAELVGVAEAGLVLFLEGVLVDVLALVVC